VLAFASRSFSVVWDIGANIGVHVLTLQKLRPQIKTVAFEASPIVFPQLAMNCRANDLQTTLLCIPLSNHRGFAQFSIKDFGSSSHSSFSPWPDTKYSIHLKVVCDRGDNVLAAGIAPQPTIIKIDVEGFEDSVLAGLPDVLSSPTLKNIVFEGPRDSV
jgi:FkbM family methyltransferase